jgi:hypothetical protein
MANASLPAFTSLATAKVAIVAALAIKPAPPNMIDAPAARRHATWRPSVRQLICI